MSTARKQHRRTPEQEARDWLKEHPGLGSLPPSRRLETGESADDERSSWFVGGSAHRDASAPENRNPIRINEDWSLDEWEQQLLRQGLHYVPVVGRTPKYREDEVERRVRIDYILDRLLPEHADLLRMRWYEEMSLEAIALEVHTSYQAVQQRLETAAQDFRREYGQHYWDDEALDG